MILMSIGSIKKTGGRQQLLMGKLLPTTCFVYCHLLKMKQQVFGNGAVF